MQVLKILYICWMIFWALGCIIGGAMWHNATFLGILGLFVKLATMPFPLCFIDIAY